MHILAYYLVPAVLYMKTYYMLNWIRLFKRLETTDLIVFYKYLDSSKSFICWDENSNFPYIILQSEVYVLRTDVNTNFVPNKSIKDFKAVLSKVLRFSQHEVCKLNIYIVC